MFLLTIFFVVFRFDPDGIVGGLEDFPIVEIQGRLVFGDFLFSLWDSDPILSGRPLLILRIAEFARVDSGIGAHVPRFGLGRHWDTVLFKAILHR